MNLNIKIYFLNPYVQPTSLAEKGVSKKFSVLTDSVEMLHKLSGSLKFTDSNNTRLTANVSIQQKHKLKTILNFLFPTKVTDVLTLSGSSLSKWQLYSCSRNPKLLCNPNFHHHYDSPWMDSILSDFKYILLTNYVPRTHSNITLSSMSLSLICSLCKRIF